MLSISSTTDTKSITCATSVPRPAELVRKIETSPATSLKKRKNAARKKLNRVIKEQQRYAKTAKLRAVAMTLTYGCSEDFSQKHISAFLDHLRRTLKRAGHILPYCWTLERAGQLHYHLLVWLPRNFNFDFARLKKWWSWGSTWAEGCRSVKAWGRYMAKFDSGAQLPKAARLFGYGGLNEAGKTAVARAGMPRWLLILLPAEHRARRCPGGGWTDCVTGEIYRSPYVWSPHGIRLFSGLIR